MSIRRFSREAIERALNIHTAEGRIRRWQPTPGHPGRITVDVVDNEPVELMNTYEQWAFVQGLAAAHHAHLRQMGDVLSPPPPGWHITTCGRCGGEATHRDGCQND
ncbi:MAG: hypothetical protein JWO67_925 [Streptosporangiaceae bacterium]|nr:hypothetical protein [Streptosporangiaceae bacterium]